MTPSIVWPRRSAALYKKTGIGPAIFLGDPEHFPDRRQPLPRAPPAVGAQRDHAGPHRVMSEVAARRAPQHEAARVLGDREELIDAHAPAVAGAAAILTPLAAIERRAGRRRHAERVEIALARPVRHTPGPPHT